MISQFSVFKITDQATKKINYIINTGDIHTILPKFNLAQSNEIKKIIQNATPISFFLFEYPFNVEVHNASIMKCIKAAELAVNNFHNPVFLLDFAGLYGKANRNIDYRPHTFIFNIFSNLLQDFINTKNSGKRELEIRFSDISRLMISSFDKVVADYNELKIISKNAETTPSLKVMIDVYMDYFDQHTAIFQESKKYAEDLSHIENDVIDYLIAEFSKHKQYEPEIVINGLINNDLNLAKEFGYYSGQHCIQRISLSFFQTIELNCLKEIMNNQTMSKIFLFIGACHANNMNELLIKCGYEKVYENISTSVEMLNQLSARGINIISSDVPELIPVLVDLLSKLSEQELTNELFEIELTKIENNKTQTPLSWIPKLFKFLNL